MKTIKTEAWVLHMGPEPPEPATLIKEDLSFPDITDDEVLVEPIYGCEAEKAFLDLVREYTNGCGVSIFIENIGSPVFRVTVKALGRQGVVTTCGWKKGMNLQFIRAAECINRHVYVHTHYAQYSEVVAAMTFAEETGWIPPDTTEVYGWDDIPQLARDFGAGTIGSYFPLFQVNAY